MSSAQTADSSQLQDIFDYCCLDILSEGIKDNNRDEQESIKTNGYSGLPPIQL